ncbi:MAG: hypothetical protein RMX65_017405 [Nostoc sp. DedQUE01]
MERIAKVTIHLINQKLQHKIIVLILSRVFLVAISKLAVTLQSETLRKVIIPAEQTKPKAHTQNAQY